MLPSSWKLITIPVPFLRSADSCTRMASSPVWKSVYKYGHTCLNDPLATSSSPQLRRVESIPINKAKYRGGTPNYYLATLTSNETIKVYDFRTFERLYTARVDSFRLPKADISFVLTACDNPSLVTTCTSRGESHIINMATNTTLHHCQIDDATISAVILGYSYLVIGYYKMNVVDGKVRKEACVVAYHCDPITQQWSFVDKLVIPNSWFLSATSIAMLPHTRDQVFVYVSAHGDTQSCVQCFGLSPTSFSPELWRRPIGASGMTVTAKHTLNIMDYTSKHYFIFSKYGELIHSVKHDIKPSFETVFVGNQRGILVTSEMRQLSTEVRVVVTAKRSGGRDSSADLRQIDLSVNTPDFNLKKILNPYPGVLNIMLFKLATAQEPEQIELHSYKFL